MSKIRFLKITTNYNQYIPGVLKKSPNILNLPYEEALKTYFYDAYGWADFWKMNLEATGKFECAEIIMNVEFLQKKWALENKFSYGKDWQKEIVTEQIKAFKPDVLMLVDLYNDNSLSATIKKLVPSIKLLLGWDGILWHKPTTYQYCDAILTPVADTAQFYKQQGKTVYYHKFGFEAEILKRLKKLEEPYRISFTGSLIPHPDYHQSRLHLTAELSRKVNMNIWASSLPKDWSLYNIPHLLSIIRHRQWKFGAD
ncbi:MAG: hypothetical protein IT236_15765, partial [Bacteroidia bacterium]|nr:hypothetical protein [Bacteroidia bacterium]